jgi:hypothetical protein
MCVCVCVCVPEAADGSSGLQVGEGITIGSLVIAQLVRLGFNPRPVVASPPII